LGPFFDPFLAPFLDNSLLSIGLSFIFYKNIKHIGIKFIKYKFYNPPSPFIL
jgi:hypothetical protein